MLYPLISFVASGKNGAFIFSIKNEVQKLVISTENERRFWSTSASTLQYNSFHVQHMKQNKWKKYIRRIQSLIFVHFCKGRRMRRRMSFGYKHLNSFHMNRKETKAMQKPIRFSTFLICAVQSLLCCSFFARKWIEKKMMWIDFKCKNSLLLRLNEIILKNSVLYCIQLWFRAKIPSMIKSKSSSDFWNFLNYCGVKDSVSSFF